MQMNDKRPWCLETDAEGVFLVLCYLANFDIVSFLLNGIIFLVQID